MIPFNRPYVVGHEEKYISQALLERNLSGNGPFTKKCQKLLEQRYNYKKVLLTTSCTDALEMCALLIDIQEGDEVIVPSYTFVSTANAFALRGAKIIFADSEDNSPNIDAKKIESLITDKTKAIVPVHYAGTCCDMDTIIDLAKKHKLFVIEDNAQGIDASYKGKPLGSLGHLSTFSFHETKNINAGECGALVINDDNFIRRSEIIWEKGTNRSQFHRGEVDKYGWMDLGSSFLPNEITAAFLLAQLENIDNIQEKRISAWNQYRERLVTISDKVDLHSTPSYCTKNAHMFYLVCKNENTRTQLIRFLKTSGIHSVFHYLSLHRSEYFKSKYQGSPLSNSDKYESRLVRLPLFAEITIEEVNYICDKIIAFFERQL